MTQFTATEARALVERLTGYTRGPWSTETDLPYMERPRVYGGDDSLICEAGNCGSSQDEWEANATLIAAAPDLHRHLTAALDEIGRMREAQDAEWNDAIHAAIHAVRGLDFEYTEPVLLALRDLLRKENDK